MNTETLNMSIRSFLKMVGVTSQQKIEQAIAEAIALGKLSGNEKVPVRMQLTIAGAILDVNFDGELELG